MREPTTREETEAQLLYDALAERTTRDFSGYEKPRATPKVPGELAFLLDDTLVQVEQELGIERAELYAEIIDLGLVSWHRRLEADECRRLKTPFLATSPEAANLRAALAESEFDRFTEREAARTVSEELQKALDAERDNAVELRAEIEALASRTDPDPAKIQSRADLAGSVPGYVPLSTHGLRGSRGKRHAGGQRR